MFLRFQLQNQKRTSLMRKLSFIPLLLLAIVSCTDDDNCPTEEAKISEIPLVTATIDGTRNYNGPLEVLPCQANSSVYIGNYNTQGEQTSFPAFYNIKDGKAEPSIMALRLPSGTYNILYRGAPTYFTTNTGALREPALSIGADLSQTGYSLMPHIGDTTYHPAYELVYAMQSFTVGNDSLHANLHHVTAALNVTVQNTNGTAITSAVDSMWVHIGSVAYTINAYSGNPSDQTKTVSFPLNESLDSKTWSAENISLLPSAPQPLMTLFIQLSNGTVKKYSKNLTHTLSAGTLTSITLFLNGISIESQTGNFTVDDWIEQSEKINVPPL